ncbi:MAG: nucleotidyltransferase domain-containing protein [bacterium]
MSMKDGIKIKKKLTSAIEYLKSIGCKEVILFGSLCDGTFDDTSDIDIAVSGVSPRLYFKAVATLPSIIKWKVDLVTMEHISKELEQRIRKEGKILYAT